MANIKGKQLSSNLAVTNVTASGHISGSNTSTGSFAHVVVTSKVSGSSVSTGSFGRVEIGAGGIDTAGDITLDGDGGDIILKDGGVEYGRFTQLLGGLTIKSGPAGIAALVIASASASPTIIVGGEIQTSKNITGSSVTTGSFGNVNALRSITAADISASVIQASQGTIDIHSLSGYVANENIDHSSVTITAGSGLTGGGDITSTRTLAVGAGTGVTVNANDVAIGQAVAASSTPTFAGLTLTGNLISDSIISGSRIATTGQITGSTISASVVQATQGTINHDSLAGFVANEHINHTSVDITAGAGLTGGGDISSTRTLAVGQGTGVTVNANDVAIGQAVETDSNVQFANITATATASLAKISGSLIESTGDFTLNSSGDIILDADGTDIILKDGGTSFGSFKRASSDFIIKAETADKDILFKGTDDSTTITALTLDMSEGGNAQFLGNISGSQIEASGDIIAFGSSDRNLKDNIQPIENPLEKMEKIGGYTFVWNNKQSTYQGKDVGVVAQEIQEVLPEIVSGRANGYLGVKYEKIVPLLIESIKELKKEVEDIKQKCDCLTK